MNKNCCITNMLELTSQINQRTRQKNGKMDSKLLVKFLCLWLVFNCILLDRAQSFTVRFARRRRYNGLNERRRDGRKRDSTSSVSKRELAKVSSTWVGCLVILKLREPLFFFFFFKNHTDAVNFSNSPQFGFSKMFLISVIAKMPRCC